jgi:hypothetical protein
MSDLQDALDLHDSRGPFADDHWTTPIVDAARRVADGVEIRYCAWHEARMPYGASQCQDPFNSHACAPGDYLLIPEGSDDAD